MFGVRAREGQKAHQAQRSVLTILLSKVRRIADRLRKIESPRPQADCFVEVVGSDGSGTTKPSVKLVADSCDILERSGLIDPMP